jgi:hypothetical protein
MIWCGRDEGIPPGIRQHCVLAPLVVRAAFAPNEARLLHAVDLV